MICIIIYNININILFDIDIVIYYIYKILIDLPESVKDISS